MLSYYIINDYKIENFVCACVIISVLFCIFENYTNWICLKFNMNTSIPYKSNLDYNEFSPGALKPPNPPPRTKFFCLFVNKFLNIGLK